MENITQVIQASTLEGNVLKLPAQQLERKLYQDTAKALEGIGGIRTDGLRIF
jgi:hypothetical protein